MSNQQQVLDPWGRASNPESTFTNEYWGQFKVDAWLCALVKGKGKVPFDPAVHERPATALDLEIVPLAEMNVTNPNITQRHIIAESDEWRQIGWASLKGLGIANLRDAVDQWVRAEMVPTGDTYEKDGRTKDRTMFKFTALFADEAACRADYATHHGASTPTPTAQPAPANGNGNGAEKAAATAFMKVIVTNTAKTLAGKPLDEAMGEIDRALAQYPGVCKYFTSQSPEVVELMMTFNTPSL